MGKIRSRIRSICRLQFADAADAASWDIAPGTGAVLPDDAALTEVKVERYASMRAETAPEGGSDVCETVITARTYCRLPGDMARKVWAARGGLSEAQCNPMRRWRRRRNAPTTLRATMPRCFPSRGATSAGLSGCFDCGLRPPCVFCDTARCYNICAYFF